MKKLLLLLLLLTGFISSAQFGGLGKKKEAPKTGGFKSSPKVEEPEKTDVYYYEQANAEIERRGSYSNIVLDNINKAIELNPSNLEYRWIRVQCNAIEKSGDEHLRQAVLDLQYMIDNGGNTAKVNESMGIIESEIGSYIFSWKKAKKNRSFTDDNSAYVKEQTEYYNDAISHYERAIAAYRKVPELNPEKSESILERISFAENKIKEIREAISQLK